MSMITYQKYKGPYAWSEEITKNKISEENLPNNFYSNCHSKYNWNEKDSCICQLVDCYLKNTKNNLKNNSKLNFEKIYPQIVSQSLQNCQKDKCYNNIPMPIFREIGKQPKNCQNLIKYDKLC